MRDGLENDEDLDAFLSLLLQQSIHTILLLARTVQVELKRQPPSMDVYSLFGKQYFMGQVPEVIVLSSD